MNGIVPVIDISPWRSAPGPDRHEIAQAVDAACCTVGFLQVTGHGIAPEVIAAALSASDRFFALPVEQKLASRPPSSDVNRGYAPLGSEALAYSLGRQRQPDLFEAFNIADDSAPPGIAPWATHLFAANIWPTEPAGFKTALLEYFNHAVSLSRSLLDMFDLALGLEPGWFRARTDHATLTMRSIRYERPMGDPVEASLGMSEHTDYGIVTVLYADAIPGLQIAGPDGAWHDVVVEPGAVLVNLGDLLAQWTNDRWKSTIHRVLPPPPGTIRRSMAMFNDGNYDAIVEVLPTCTSHDKPPRYAPVVAGEHIAAKILGPRRQTPVSATDTAAGRIPSE